MTTSDQIKLREKVLNLNETDRVFSYFVCLHCGRTYTVEKGIAEADKEREIIPYCCRDTMMFETVDDCKSTSL